MKNSNFKKIANNNFRTFKGEVFPISYGTIGTDVEKVSRFKLDKKADSRLLNRIFSKKELAYCFSKSKPEQHLSGRFSAKESIIKALSHINGTPLYCAMPDIEIVNNNGLPMAKLLDKELKGYTVQVSIAHSKDTVFTVALVTSRTKHT